MPASPDAVVSRLKSGMHVFVHGAAATPTPLLEALARRTDLVDVRLWHLHLEGPTPFAAPEHAGRFRSVSLFTGAGLHGPVAEGRRDLGVHTEMFSDGLVDLVESGAAMNRCKAISPGRIVRELKAGAGVVTTRGHVHWVVTEYGAVNLHGKTLAERGRLLASVAHPAFRDGLVASLRDLRRLG